jgi:Na+-translocating ferredoxin:NAD+ oxidoreductase RnfA subunit
VSWPGILLAFSLVENVLFARLLGLDAGTGGGRLDLRRAAGAGLAAGLLAAGSAAAVWALRVNVLEPRGLVWLQTPSIILVTAGIAALARLVLRGVRPGASEQLGSLLRPSGAAVAALGVVLVAVRARFGLLQSLVAGLAAGGGLIVALAILAGIDDRLGPGEDRSAMSGLPRALVSAGLAALAFTVLDQVLLSGLVR